MIGNRKCPPLNFIGLLPAGSSALSQVVDRSSLAEQGEAVCVLDNRHNQAFFSQRGRYTNIDLAVQANALIAPG